MKHVSRTLRERTDGWTKKQITLTAGDYRHRAILDSIKQRDFAICKKLYSDMIDHHVEL